VYLKHLATGPGGTIAVYHHESKRFQFWTDEQGARDQIAEAKIRPHRPHGRRGEISELLWLGPDMAAFEGYDRAANPHHAPSRYVTDRELVSNEKHPLERWEENPRGVYTLLKQSRSNRRIFRQAVIDCIRPFRP